METLPVQASSSRCRIRSRPNTSASQDGRTCRRTQTDSPHKHSDAYPPEQETEVRSRTFSCRSVQDTDISSVSADYGISFRNLNISSMFQPSSIRTEKNILSEHSFFSSIIPISCHPAALSDTASFFTQFIKVIYFIPCSLQYSAFVLPLLFQFLICSCFSLFMTQKDSLIISLCKSGVS